MVNCVRDLQYCINIVCNIFQTNHRPQVTIGDSNIERFIGLYRRTYNILLLSIVVFRGRSFHVLTKKKEKREIVRCLYRCAKKTSRNESENLEKQNNRKIDRSGNPIIYQYIIIRVYSLPPTYICKVDSNLRRHVDIITSSILLTPSDETSSPK